MLILGVPCFKELDCRQYGANDLAYLDAQHIRHLPCVDLEPGSGGDWMPWSLATSICFFVFLGGGVFLKRKYTSLFASSFFRKNLARGFISV